MTAPDAVQVVPRLWIGSNKTCDAVRGGYQFVCINVGAKPHTNDQRCNVIPLCVGDVVDYAQMAKIERLIVPLWPQGNVLLHCSNGLTYSALAAALWLSSYYSQSLATSYQWIKAKQPAVQDLSGMAAPVAKNTAWAGA